MNLELAKLRWFTRTVISLTELGIFVFIIWLVFMSESTPSSEFLNSTENEPPEKKGDNNVADNSDRNL